MSTRKTSKSLSRRRPKSEPIRRRSIKSISVKRPTSEPIHFKIPKPLNAPKNIKRVVENIQDTLDNLSQIGKEKGAVHYRGNTNMAQLAYVTIINKFKDKCIPRSFGVELQLIINSNPEETDILNDDESLTYFGERLKECINNNIPIICIYLGLRFEEDVVGHANILIYRPFERIIERFEPHGSNFWNDLDVDMSINNQLKELFEDKLNTYTGDPVRYFPPRKICPYVDGFQSLEGQIEGLDIEGGGFCVMWSLFVMEMVLNNPKMKTRDIIDKVMEITKKEPETLKQIIRGYVVSIEKLLDSTLKKIGEPGFSFEKNGYINKYSNNIYSFILNSVFETSRGTRPEMSYKSLPKSLEMDLFDKLMGLSRNQLKELTLNINKTLPSFIDYDRFPIKYIVDIILTLYNEEQIEQALDELLSEEEKRLSK